MGFHNRLQKILNKSKPKVIRKICGNFWCKVWFDIKEDIYNSDIGNYSQCKKCRGYTNDPLMSGGVENNGIREYEGSRYDGEAHETLYKEYKDGKFE